MVGQVTVSPSLKQFKEIGSAYPEFANFVAIGLENPLLNRNQAQTLYCSMMCIDLLVDDAYFLMGSKYMIDIFNWE